MCLYKVEKSVLEPKIKRALNNIESKLKAVSNYREEQIESYKNLKREYARLPFIKRVFKNEPKDPRVVENFHDDYIDVVGYMLEMCIEQVEIQKGLLREIEVKGYLKLSKEQLREYGLYPFVEEQIYTIKSL